MNQLNAMAEEATLKWKDHCVKKGQNIFPIDEQCFMEGVMTGMVMMRRLLQSEAEDTKNKDLAKLVGSFGDAVAEGSAIDNVTAIKPPGDTL